MIKRGYGLVLLVLFLLFSFIVYAQEEDLKEHHEEEDKVNIPNSVYIIYLVIGGISIILSILFFKKLGIKKLSKYWIFLLILIVISYGWIYYSKSNIQKEGVVICKTENDCVLASHIHANVDGSVCGEPIKLPLDTGDSTKEPHTHKERNRIHWESLLKVDGTTKEILDYTPLKLGTFMQVMDINFNSTCIYDKCNGDLCNDKVGRLKMWVNNIENNQYDNYVWKDGDLILIKFEGE